MAYNKQIWKAGDKITAKKLNHMEEGIAASGNGDGSEKFIVTVTSAEEDDEIVYSADKSVAECLAAYEDGKVVVCHLDMGEEVFYEVPILLAIPEDGVTFSAAVGVDGNIGTMYIRGDIDNTHDDWRVELEEIAGGAEKFVVNIFREDGEHGGTTYAADKTIAEIVTAYNANKVIELHYDDELVAMPTIITDEYVSFTAVIGEEEGCEMQTFIGVLEDNEETWMKYDNDMYTGDDTSLPSVTSDDNGDVLTVVEGEWAKAAPSGCKFVVTLGKALETIATLELAAQPNDETGGFLTWAGQMEQSEYEAINEASHIYFNSKDCEANSTGDSGTLYISYNFELNGSNIPNRVLEQGKTAYWLMIDKNNYQYEFACDSDISSETINIKTESEGYTADHSISECFSAIDTGKIVECLIYDAGFPVTIPYVASGISDGHSEIIFSTSMTYQEDHAYFMGVVGISYNGNDTWMLPEARYIVPKTDFEVEFYNDKGTFKCRQTYSDIYSAYTDERPFKAYYKISDNGGKCFLTLATWEPHISDSSKNFFTFVGYYALDNTNLTTVRFVIKGDNTVQYTRTTDAFDV